MATLVTVHGTYAQDGSTPPDQPQWWQSGSTFQKEVMELLQAPDGNLHILPFGWSGDNSETARREAGARLFQKLKELEARQEPYCLVGHSHGGSVIAAALLESAAKKQPLDHLKRWITVGTPFVTLRRERLLFSRLDLPRKVVFVASMMLLLMFLVFFLINALSGERMIGTSMPEVFALTAGMMSLPALLTYLVLKYMDSLSLLHYRRSVKARARQWFGPRWLSLTHPSDEAVQGLSLLPEARLSFFDRAFAVSAITILSVVALPVLYLSMLASPATMTGLGDWLLTKVYESRSSPEAENAVRSLRRKFADARKAAEQRAEPATSTRSTGKTAAPAPSRNIYEDFRAERKQLEAKYPEYRSAERTQRFRQRFFERDGKPCNGGKLCGGGRDWSVNSGLLLHVVTDELSWALGVEALGGSFRLRWLWSLIVPAILVPLAFIAMALAIMLAIRAIASVVSSLTSTALNNLTNAEVKRAAFGNDTEGEIALGAADHPTWMERSPARLPKEPAEIITRFSNDVAGKSLDKFRRAIGDFASRDRRQSADNGFASYFTWKELVHGAYFDVPEFRKLVVRTAAEADGFAPSAKFRADADFARAGRWVAELMRPRPVEGKPVTGETRPSDKQDAQAVAAVVGSTIQDKG